MDCLTLGEILELKNGEKDDVLYALHSIEKIYKIDGFNDYNNKGAWYALFGIIYSKLDRSDEAIDMYLCAYKNKDTLGGCSNYISLIWNLGREYIKKHDFEMAFSFFDVLEKDGHLTDDEKNLLNNEMKRINDSFNKSLKLYK